MTGAPPPAAGPDAGASPCVSLPDGSGGVLCTACGLCCMGALHDRAKLEPRESEWAEAIGLPVLPSRTEFRLPCPKLVDRKCTIFDSRPDVCPRYRCQLLKDADAGRVGLEEALGHVAQAHELFRAAMAALTGTSLTEARDRARFLSVGDALARHPADPQAALNERLRVTALDVYLDRHFRNDRDSRMFKAAEDGSGEMDVEEAGEPDRKP